MKKPSLLIICAALIAFIAVSCLISEYSWRIRESTRDNARKIIGLSSIAVGNLNPAARNPGLEFLCTGLYDDPGGYCYYFTNGIPFVTSTFENATVTRTK